MIPEELGIPLTKTEQKLEKYKLIMQEFIDAIDRREDIQPLYNKHGGKLSIYLKLLSHFNFSISYYRLDARDEDIGKLYLDGADVYEIANQFHLHYSTVQIILRSKNVITRVRAKSIAIKADLAKGYGTKVIAEKYGIPDGNVRYYRKRFKDELKKKS